MTKCKKSENSKKCNCTYPCEKKGICCECVEYHKNRRELPACFFPKEEEKTYDRSFENFSELVKEKKV